jgi:hypothetical protein
MSNHTASGAPALNDIPIYEKRVSNYYPEGRSLVDRFWASVDVRSGDECWYWLASTTPAGYGQLGYYDPAAKRTVIVRTHRLSYLMHHGPLVDGLVVMHSCDNPRCVNPHHLSQATQLDNMNDCIDKGRLPTVPDPVEWRARRQYRIDNPPRIGGPRLGEVNGLAKLNSAKVIAIRDSFERGDMTIRELAELHGVTHGAVWQVVNRRTWRHVR